MSNKTMDVLNVRAKTIETIVKKMEGESVKDMEDPAARVIGELMISAIKEAAGMGFDAGFSEAVGLTHQ